MNNLYIQERLIKQRREADLRWADQVQLAKQAAPRRADPAPIHWMGSQPMQWRWRQTRRTLTHLAAIILSSWMH